MKKNGIERIGEIGVDAGLCWIGDPCYILHQERPPAAIGKDWGAFCDTIGELHTSFPFDHGHPGLGVCVNTGYGDGLYPVFAEFKDDVLVKVWVEFVTEEDEDEHG